MKDPAEISFDEAVGGLREFISSRGVPGEIVWLFREDIVAIGGKYGPDLFRAPGYHVNIGQTAGNVEHARRFYKLGREKGLGIALIAFISLGDRVGCRVEIPEDDTDGQYKMIPLGGLKYACVENMPKAALVKNPLKWWLLKMISDPPEDTWLAGLPSKY